MSTSGKDNARKDAARKRQKATGEPYMRARRAVTAHQPLTVTLGFDDHGQEVRVNLDPVEFGGSGPHCVITGKGGSGKTHLAVQICRELASRDPAVEVIVSASEALRRLFPGRGTTFIDSPHSDEAPRNFATVLNDLLDSRVTRLREANVYDMRSYRDLGNHMSDAVVVLDDPGLWANWKESAEAVVRLARTGRSAGIHLITVIDDQPARFVAHATIDTNSGTRIHLTGGQDRPPGEAICERREEGRLGSAPTATPGVPFRVPPGLPRST